jgi:[methyl-Co(III) methanol-specific corrinoid protein]:coenzyme M methyltransferase
VIKRRKVMSEINFKTRLLNAINKKPVDRVPVVCPGGMMNMAVVDVMKATSCFWPEAHIDPEQMARLSLGVQLLGGIENVGVPFCMTVEAEAMGAKVYMGTRETEPRVVEYPLNAIDEWRKLPELNETHYRVEVVFEAIKILKKTYPEIPVIGNLTGPISLATSLMEPMDFYKALRKNPGEAMEFLEFVAENIVKFGVAMTKAGADVINLADPSGTGEILGPKVFGEAAVPVINKITESIEDATGVPVMVHICGRLLPVLDQLKNIKSRVLSIDAITNLRKVKQALPEKVIMGNVSTFLLEKGTPERVRKAAIVSINQGAGILSPACGIGANTPIENIRAMADAAKIGSV